MAQPWEPILQHLRNNGLMDYRITMLVINHLATHAQYIACAHCVRSRVHTQSSPGRIAYTSTSCRGIGCSPTCACVMRRCVRARVSVYLCMCACVCLCVSVSVCMCVRLSLSLSLSVCASVCVCLFTLLFRCASSTVQACSSCVGSTRTVLRFSDVSGRYSSAHEPAVSDFSRPPPRADQTC